ncbi:MAG: protein O-mannosyl-transferase family, partial [Bacteroidia bacterium]
FKAYSRLNNVIGWLIFAIAAFTYLSTMERTVSLWDTGEFISAAYRLEVCHPPGAPMFLLIYKIFTLFAPSPDWVPIMTNAASALSSAFTILFLFWSITALAIKMVKDQNNIERGDLYAILASGAVGALAYTFSDTFWFSAVESEVYALSSMFTALVFWLALKWDRRANEPNNLRWLVLIFYLVGVVIGIHLLGLLVIPVVVLMYYFKKYKTVTNWGILAALGIGFVVLGLVQYGTIQGLPALATKMELLFVNNFGLPFWSGAIFFFVLFLGVMAYFIWYSHKRRMVLLNTALLCFASVIIGYSSYAMCVIRSYANPSIDMNDPEDVFTLISYLSREQYGDNYLVTGPYYTAYTKGGISVENGRMQYRIDKKAGEYKEAGEKRVYKFHDKFTTVFPRMFNGSQPNYISGYKYWGDIKNEDKISFIRNNLRFFWNYQMKYMYFRYFFWNFVGRQNDIQGVFNEFHQGNWITGIPFIDESLAGAGPQSDLPVYLKDNKARNTLFGLPLILGILGLIYQYKRDRRDFITTFIFFFMTGIAIALYLNMPSPQPRERDYAFVGSFYVFAIWIGLGVLYIYDLLKNKLPSPTAALVAGTVSLIAVPVLMASQEWDDHDRSMRTASLDYGVNYLESVAKVPTGAVMFTNGDNDTYPLWYAQEVEGIRDDIRIINLSLFGTDWYVNQMRKPINKAPGLKFTLTEEQTLGWDYLQYDQSVLDYKGLSKQINQNEYLDAIEVLKFIGSTDPISKVPTSEGNVPYMPTRKLRFKVDKEKVLRNGTVPAEMAGQVVDFIDVDLSSKTNFMKSDIMLLDFIATNNWEVPIYFSITSGQDEYQNLGSYLQQEGLAYRLVPVKNPTPGGEQRVATNIMYNNMMTKFRWGKLDEVENANVDFVLGNQSQNLRSVFQRLAGQLLMEGKTDEARKVIEKCLKVLPENNVPYNFFMVPLADIYFRTGAKEPASKLADRVADVLIQEMDYYAKVKNSELPAVQGEIQRNLYGLRSLVNMGEENNLPNLVKKVQPKLDVYSQRFAMFDQQGQ